MLPYPILPDRFYMVTRRTTQRQFLMRPDAATNNAFLYCIICAAKRFEIVILLPVAMSNHHHTVVYDPHGNIVEFEHYLHTLFARSQNMLRGRTENFWSTEPTCRVELIDTSAVIERLIYAATNPVTAGLVERAHHWPGVNEITAFLNQAEIRATRPRHFFSDEGPMPDEVSLRLTIPPQLGDAETVIARVREGVARVEEKQRALRLASGRCIVGRARVLRQSWHDAPTTHEPRREIRPRVATRNKWARIAALQRNHVFIDAYRVAREHLLANDPIPFPPGTYWLRRFAGVPIAAAN